MQNYTIKEYTNTLVLESTSDFGLIKILLLNSKSEKISTVYYNPNEDKIFFEHVTKDKVPAYIQQSIKDHYRQAVKNGNIDFYYSDLRVNPYVFEPATAGQIIYMQNRFAVLVGPEKVTTLTDKDKTALMQVYAYASLRALGTVTPKLVQISQKQLDKLVNLGLLKLVRSGYELTVKGDAEVDNIANTDTPLDVRLLNACIFYIDQNNLSSGYLMINVGTTISKVSMTNANYAEWYYDASRDEIYTLELTVLTYAKSRGY